MHFASEFVYAKKRGDIRQPQINTCFAIEPEEPDTNVISARFDHLVETHNSHAGEPYFCAKCEAVLSNKSVLSNPDPVDRKRVWKCEFCSNENRLFVENEEIPVQDEVTYILETETENIAENNSDDQYLIYCIDISGSMSVSTPVNGNFRLPTDALREEMNRNLAGEFYHQNQSLKKYITRLNAVQVAIDDNLNKLEANNPNKKVGIVTFNKTVQVIGDGKMNEIQIKDAINSKDEIEKVAQRTPEFDAVKNNKLFLREKLLSLEEGGATALGPALYYSILIASRKKGSQVILCTDGLANQGIGSLEVEDMNETIIFYNELGNFALLNGVSVSIITIEGTNCKLGLLGDIANKSGGLVNVVNPLKLKEEFSSVLDEPVIATNVVSTLILHNNLYVRDYQNSESRLSTITKEIGNVTKETEITFEFGVRDDIEIKQKELPFQLKIIYNALNGAKCLRVLTKNKGLTNDKNIAEKHSNRTILASNLVQNQSKLAQNRVQASNFSQFSSYIKQLAPIKDDGFSREEYNRLENDLCDLRTTTESSQLINNSLPPMAQPLSMVSDTDASRFYKLGKITSKNLSKNEKK